MPNKKLIKAIRIEYETKDRTSWKANILAYSIQEALDYIRRNVPTFDKYVSTSVLADIDAIEDKVYDDFFVNRTEVIETVVQRQPLEDGTVGESKVSCPWCRKEFANNITLGTHIKKFHLDK
jgi:hypothetical protein